MNKLTYFCFLSVLLFLLNGCLNNHETETKNQTGHNRLHYKLVIYDSVVIDNYTGTLLITDAVNDYVLGFDLKTNEILLINAKTEKIRRFNKKGGGPFEYGRIKGLSFFNDSTLLLMDNNSLIFYDLAGNGLKAYNISSLVGMTGWNFQFNIPSFLEGKDTCIIVRHYNYNFESGNIAKVKWLSCINISKHNIQKFAPFSKNNYLSQNTNETFPDIVPIYTISNTRKEVLLKYPYNAFLTTYTLSNLKYKDEINLFPDHFKAIPRKRNQSNQQIIFVNEQINSSFTSLYSGKDVVIAGYKSGIPTSKIVRTRAELIQNNTNLNDRDYYAICVFNNGALSDNIKLNWDRNKLMVAFVISSERVYFYNISSLEKEENSFMLYVGKFTNK